jgi:hypothetical protein
MEIIDACKQRRGFSRTWIWTVVRKIGSAKKVVGLSEDDCLLMFRSIAL